MVISSFGGLSEEIVIDPEWDLAIAEISQWLKATKQIAFTPRSGKPFIVHPKRFHKR